MTKLNRVVFLAGAALAISTLAPAAEAAQTVYVTPAAAALLPTVRFDLGYAVAGRQATEQGVLTNADTIVSIGLSSGVTATCYVQLAWYDWNGVLTGVSGGYPVGPGRTYEFTTSVNSLQPGEHPPYVENIFRNTSKPFEGYAQIRSNCTTVPMRADAQFVLTDAKTPSPPTYKPIRIMKTTGLVGD